MSEKKSKMPAEVTEIYDALYQDVCWLHAKWQVFRQLYVDNEGNVALLNSSAPGFFRICQDMLINEVLLAISRLTDPDEVFRKKNLSLDQMAVRIDAGTYPILKSELTTALANVSQSCGFVRILRDKRIAHSDLPIKLGNNIDPLPTATVKKIDSAISAITKVMNLVEQTFHHVPVSYDGLAIDDGNMVLARLREAKKHREHRRTNWGAA